MEHYLEGSKMRTGGADRASELCAKGGARVTATRAGTGVSEQILGLRWCCYGFIGKFTENSNRFVLVLLKSWLYSVCCSFCGRNDYFMHIFLLVYRFNRTWTFYRSGELSEVSPGMAETVQSRVSGIGYSVSQMHSVIFISCDEKCFGKSFLSVSKLPLLT